jgi:hypothetical protein
MYRIAEGTRRGKRNARRAQVLAKLKNELAPVADVLQSAIDID